MTTISIEGVLDYIIANARLRAEKYPSIGPAKCEESVAIFDELDSLAAEEFAVVYELYLVGSGIEGSRVNAEKVAQAAKYESLNSMAFNPNLHSVLANGRARWLQLSQLYGKPKM